LGGVRHYNTPDEPSGTTHFFSIGEALSLFKDDPLLHEPGTKYQYTTYGFNLLGCAVEGASGSRYMDYMTKNVFGPSLMIQTQQDMGLQTSSTVFPRQLKPLTGRPLSPSP
jgi:CubicO group peptidase (beta-lactamase class C family)